MPKEFRPLSGSTGGPPPSFESGSQLSPADKRDIAIALFFELATSLLRKIEPLVDAAVKEKHQ